MDFVFEDRINSTSDAVEKHNSHLSVMKIRQQYGNESTVRLNIVDENCEVLYNVRLTPVKPHGRMIISRVK